jgi:hypothetical protein
MKTYLIAPVLALLSQNAFAEPWESPQQCYDDHIQMAKGAYPLPGDDPSELRAYCEKAYKMKKCNFTCDTTRAKWNYSLNVSPRKRGISLRGYFLNRCGIWPTLTGRCDD